MRRLVLCLVALLLLAALPARAADTLRVGRSPGWLFSYVPLDVGIAKGFFSKRGLDIKSVDFEGASKADQGLVAGAIDISLGSPMGMAMEVKGMPTVAIAVIAGPMLEFGVFVPYDSPINSLDQLKGKTIGIATVGSITQWVALELARVKGWGPDGIKLTALGSGTGSAAAALKSHLVDALIGTTSYGPLLERNKEGRLIATAADFVQHFQAHTMFATRAILRDRPDDVRQFVAGWLESVAYMRAHRDETIVLAQKVTNLSPADEAVEYDKEIAGISPDGKFDPQDLKRIGASFVELKILDKAPDMSTLYTENFLPRE